MLFRILPLLYFFLLILLRDIMNNKVFYQHPNLMRVLGMHETVMEVMVNVLGGDKSQVIMQGFIFLPKQAILKLEEILGERAWCF